MFKNDHANVLLAITCCALLMLGAAYICAHTPVGKIIDAIISE